MAQKDTKVSIELALSSAAISKASKDDSAIMRQIAIETKRDSSAMKTIAVLGIFFSTRHFGSCKYFFLHKVISANRRALGYIRHASFQLGWRRCACYQKRILVLLGCNCAADHFCSNLLGYSYVTSMESMDIKIQWQILHKRL